EEKAELKPEPAEQIEIPEDTPYYRNPDVLNDEDPEKFDFKAEEKNYSETEKTDIKESKNKKENIFEGQSPEKIENVLNSGMEFVGGLVEMATGKKIEKSSSEDKMIEMDKDTGEVTIKFRLPV
ncbi:MAG: DEAD/DEAH box helicase, partial [Thermodesulfobacteriota bacterium]